MNQEELQALLEQIGPRNLLMIIQMLTQLSESQLQQLVQQLAQLVQQEDQGGALQEAPPDQAQSNMYG